jgi:hypothetical protein
MSFRFNPCRQRAPRRLTAPNAGQPCAAAGQGTPVALLQPLEWIFG